LADLAITPVVGPEVLSGSTRLKAGTATKLILNMLSTGAMVRLGKAYGNLMVDLCATNSKLRARANRIVRTLTGLSKEEADALLFRCDGDLKTAIVVQQAQVNVEEAQARLAAVGGQVGKAMQETIRADDEPDTEILTANLLLGIDGGGSHTVALLAAADGDNRWTILGRGEAGPSNLQAVGSAAALAALDKAVAAVFAATKRPRATVAAACLGLAGAARPDDQEIIMDWARYVRLAGEVEIKTDAEILLAAGTPGGWGLAIIAGTGSIAYGRRADGRTARAGGWGYLLGDEGSGYALTLAGLQAVVQAADQRGAATSLSEQFLTRLGLKKPQELVRAIYQGGLDRAALAELAPLVLQSAEEGDPVALAIVDKAANELAVTAATVVRKLDLPSDELALALSGGVLLASEDYRQRILKELASLGVHPDPVTLVHEPSEGSVRLALQKHVAGRQPS
jgi:N-acetylglucosamine kinase-like BadF-type ATPase